MTTTHVRRSYAKGVERREQIIQTAADVFATEGFEGTALKHVAELVGVREATLFHYFGSKQELLTAVLTERDLRSTRDVIEDRGSILTALPQIAARNATQPGLTTLYAVASATANEPGHASHEFFRHRFESIVDDVATDIAAQQAAGSLRADLPATLLARLVVAASDGLQLQWMYDKDVNMAEGLGALISTLFAPAGVSATAAPSTIPNQHNGE